MLSIDSLRNLGTDEATIAAVIAIHDTSCYHIQQQGTATSVRTTRGIRQGCRLAPMLWVVISTAILARLQEPLNGPHRQGTTFADGTLCQWLISDPEDTHQLTAFLTLLLQVMEDLGLLVNLTKTVLLVRVRGSAGQRAVRQHTCWKVGTVLSLKSGEEKAAKHRLTEARSRNAKIRRATNSRQLFALSHRIRIWKACAVSSAVFGLGPIGLTAKSAVLLRQWFHKQLRAVTGSQAFITEESNAALRERAAVQDPVDALADSVARKLEKLQLKEPDITNTPDIVAHWESCRDTFDGLRTTVSTDSIVPAPPPRWKWRAMYVECISPPSKPCVSTEPPSTRCTSERRLTPPEHTSNT